MAKIPVREEHPRDPRLGVRCAFTTGERKHHGPLFDRLAVITGAGTGMGRELALALAKEGAHLALCDLASDTLEETASAARASAQALP